MKVKRKKRVPQYYEPTLEEIKLAAEEVRTKGFTDWRGVFHPPWQESRLNTGKIQRVETQNYVRVHSNLCPIQFIAAES